jgi:hypothetical protein
MRKKTFFKFIFVSLISAVCGAGMFLGFITYVIPRLVVLVPEPNINLADIGCPSGTYEDMNRNRCSISTQSKAALAYVLEGSGVGISSEGTPNPVILRKFATQISATEKGKFKLLHAAALFGDAESQFLVGAMYSKGKGTVEDNLEALKWLNESAHNGYPKAQLRLAYMLSAGEFVKKDEEAALVWMEKVKNSKVITQQRIAGI